MSNDNSNPDPLAGGSGVAQRSSGQTVSTFLGSLGTSAAIFGVQIFLFYLLKDKFTRIYRPKTYLVPEKDRTKPPPRGLFKWIVPVFSTSNAELMSKCGLDAYFFLRYLRMLLKIFIPSAVIILTVLLPINRRANNESITGLDKLGWTNYDKSKTNRFWAHLVCAVGLLVWTAIVIYTELRGYIRVRQAYLTSPQHRLRASATTVLLRSVPRKWLTVEALDGLFDVFPGGIRNIWINRDFDELNQKVKKRDQLAMKLESAETALIRNAKKKQMDMVKKEEKTGKKMSKAEKKKQDAETDAAAFEAAAEGGISTGNPHQAHTVGETLGHQDRDISSSDDEHDKAKLGAFGQGFDAVRGGFGIVGQGITGVGQGITGFGKKFISDVRGAPKRFDDRVEHAYEGAGFSFDGQREPLVGAQPNRGRGPESTPATAATEFPGATPETATTAQFEGRGVSPPSPVREPQAGVAQHDYGTERAVEPSPPKSSGARPLKSEDTARTAVNDSQPVRPSADSRKAPGKLDLSNQGHVQAKKKKSKWWDDSHDIELPTPEPAKADEAQLGEELTKTSTLHGDIGTGPSLMQKIVGFVTRRDPKTDDDASIREDYPDAFDEQYADDKGMDNEPVWKRYLKEGDRDTMRLPVFGWEFMPYMPSWTFIGQKVDTIYYCRKEVARLNLEIETDQKEPEKFPLMNSAFIQFNNQVAAHMACQSVAHHFPNTMAPRLVEIAPGDVLWDNMSIGYKMRFGRQVSVILIVVGLVILWAVPVSITSAFANLRDVEQRWNGAFGWIGDLPDWLISLLQGVLPPVLLAILLALLPVVLRFLASFQGVPTGMSVELDVQGFYFAFLFVQIFLVVTVANSIFNVINEIGQDPSQAAYILARNIPKAANYFFSYLILQALSVSSGALAQIAQLVLWFLLRPIMDNTARQKFNRQLNLQNVKWGTFFPVYTNFACIGLIYAVISPLVMVFNIITFALFWVTYRYQTLYVTKYQFDTGGLLFPKAINQLFTGLYVMEVALIGLFLLVDDDSGDETNTPCYPQAIVMGVMLVLTVGFQILLNYNFSPLFRYMPITLEDDAVARDEEFATLQAKKWGLKHSSEDTEDTSEGKSKDGEEDIEDQLEHKEAREQDEEAALESIEMEEIKKRKAHKGGTLVGGTFRNAASKAGGIIKAPSKVGSWADRSRNRKSRLDHGSPHPDAVNQVEKRRMSRHHTSANRHSTLPREFTDPDHPSRQNTDVPELPRPATMPKNPGSNRPKMETIDHTTAVGDALFGAFSDEIEDLTAEERDTLVQRAFQHAAMRARRPVIWLPRDDLGVSDDEIRRMQAFSGGNLWVSNEGTGLDRKARVLFRRAPPDFSEVDLIEL